MASDPHCSSADDRSSSKRRNHHHHHHRHRRHHRSENIVDVEIAMGEGKVDEIEIENHKSRKIDKDCGLIGVVEVMEDGEIAAEDGGLGKLYWNSHSDVGIAAKGECVREDSRGGVSSSLSRGSSRSREASVASTQRELEGKLSRDDREDCPGRYDGGESRDKYREVSKKRERSIDGTRERGKERGKERVRSRDRDRREERERGKKRKERDNEGDRSSQLKKDEEEEYRNWYGHSRKRRNSKDNRTESLRKDDLDNARENQGNIEEPTAENDDDDVEEYQKKVAMQLAEQEEEDDLERIKEESRRRREAILEKHKKLPQPSQKVASPVENIDDDQMDDADDFIVEPSVSVRNSTSQNEPLEKSDDMFCDDMFGDSPDMACKTGKGGASIANNGLVHDNWDDAERYYSYRLGEILDGRYEIIAAHGKGVFSTVVRAKDLRAKEEVAIKIIRNNDVMLKAGMEELVILKKLVGADPENKRHCVRFISSFRYRNHLCLVFESLLMNLRKVVKKFGRNIGLKLSTGVKPYAKQLFIALKHLKNCGVLHCDIKPDNMLVNEARNVLKLCDFGSAMFAGNNEITPYLASRFYRAPEIILGLPYDHPLDIWSVGCCLFELYTGKVLFPGATNNDMLRLHMELKGPFPKKMLRKGAFTGQHFDQDLNFLATEEDPVTKRAMKRLITNIKPKDFGSLITVSDGEDPKIVANFKDLLEKIFVLDPEKRLDVSQALSHPFITGR